ncbi:hypothetical protein, partial [Enterococcus termitis]
KELSEACDVSQTTINELRSGKRELRKTSLQNALSLYHFACRNEMNAEHIMENEKKGKFSTIPLNLSVSKVLVSFENLDLFAYGVLKQSYNDAEFPNRKDRLENLHLSTAVFITKDGKIYNCEEFGYTFNCRYNGAGPNNLVRFLQKFSNLDEAQLSQVIHANSVVEYDFQTDTIAGYPSLIEGQPITLLSFNEKLIIMLNKYENSSLKKWKESVTLESAPSDILFLTNTLEENYKLSAKIKAIYHIPKNAQNEQYSLSQLPRFQRPNNGIQIVIEYEDFEIWLPYKIYQAKGDIFENEEMNLFLNGLGITYNPEKKNFIQTLLDSKEPIDKISTLPVYYEDEL